MYSGHGHAERRYVDIWRGIQRCATDPVQPACMVHLTRHTGVSKRTLWNACRKFTHLSPIAHIKSKRMIMAHEMLCRANSSSTTVTEVAMLFGFEELGRFSVRYRQMLGRRPSLTLDELPSASQRH